MFLFRYFAVHKFCLFRFCAHGTWCVLFIFIYFACNLCFLSDFASAHILFVEILCICYIGACIICLFVDLHSMKTSKSRLKTSYIYDLATNQHKPAVKIQSWWNVLFIVFLRGNRCTHHDFDSLHFPLLFPPCTFFQLAFELGRFQPMYPFSLGLLFTPWPISF